MERIICEYNMTRPSWPRLRITFTKWSTHYLEAVYCLESEPGGVEGSVHPYVDPFSTVHLQMRAKMSQKDLPSLSCRIMNGLRPTAPHMLNFCLWNHIPANLFPPLVFSSEPTTTSSSQAPGGQELGSILPLQTQSLMARNSSRKSCSFADCVACVWPEQLSAAAGLVSIWRL